MDATPNSKFTARKLLNEAMRIGFLTRKPCIECGNPKTHGHHPDYSKPLEVIWLCALHHRRAHASTLKKYEPAGNERTLGLTKRQFQVLGFIRNFITEHKYSPSYEEIGVGLNLSSLATVFKHVKALRDRGYITKENQSRSIAVCVS